MKTKRTTLALGIILLSAVGLCGCGGSREYAEMTTDNAKTSELTLLEDADRELSPSADANAELSPTTEPDSPQLTALADSLEEAQEIADLYGIELDSYSYGVAAYSTDKDISELLRMGEENDYPTLAPNQTSVIHSDTVQ